MFDDIDLRILAMLKEDARVANAAIARDVDLAPSAVFQRIRKLEEKGVIQGYHARIDPDALDQGLLAFISVQTGEGARAKETAEMLAAVPEVLEVHRVVGDDCFYLKVRVKDTGALGALLDEKIQTLDPVASTNTTIVLSTAKEQDVRLPDTGPSPASDSGTPSGSRRRKAS
ncbi:MAG: Lrp/AsnC family transcriptional regulator [Candidatus Longimicrobiales bacterium M2_2A_002]